MPRQRHVGLPRAASRTSSGAAPLKDNHFRILQLVLFWAGAILLPLGLVVIILGWYGAANTPYQYDQLSYLVSGGLLGLGLTFCGGFLYFGAWLARIASDQREAAKRLADTLLVLADVTSRAATSATPSRPGRRRRDPGDRRRRHHPPPPRLPAGRRTATTCTPSARTTRTSRPAGSAGPC